jgi:hypothetical protein
MPGGGQLSVRHATCRRRLDAVRGFAMRFLSVNCAFRSRVLEVRCCRGSVVVFEFNGRLARQPDLPSARIWSRALVSAACQNASRLTHGGAGNDPSGDHPACLSSPSIPNLSKISIATQFTNVMPPPESRDLMRRPGDGDEGDGDEEETSVWFVPFLTVPPDTGTAGVQD